MTYNVNVLSTRSIYSLIRPKTSPPTRSGRGGSETAISFSPREETDQLNDREEVEGVLSEAERGLQLWSMDGAGPGRNRAESFGENFNWRSRNR